MIVSCESCKSRYKLDDNKITGRGAKITCPKCKHVFVVLAPTPPAPEVVRVGADPQRPDSDWEDDEPTRVGRDLGAQAQAALGETETPIGSVVTAAARAAISRDTYEVSRPRVEQAAPPAMSKEEVQARAGALDFRKVGVTAWKVKVRIGLVYDFSDTRTLRKYIADGRVTAADVISYDGKTWKPIGEIPDLDEFFVQTFDRLSVEQAARGEPPRESPALADLGNVAAELAAAAAAEEERNEASGRGPVYQDPFEQLKQKQRDRMQQKRVKKPDEGRGGVGLWVGVAAVLLVGSVGLWYLSRTDGGSGESTTISTATTVPNGSGAKTGRGVEAAPAGPTREEIQRAIDEEAKAKAEASGGEASAAVAENTAAPAPVDCPEGYLQLGNGKCMRPEIPGGVSAVAAPPATAAVRAGGAPSSAPVASTTAPTDDEQVGDDAARGGDWNTAIVAYTKAVSKKGESGALLAKLGEAQLRVGDPAGAQGTLNKAVQKGSTKSHKLLARIASEAGDTAGAKTHYQAYLAAFPNDAEAKKGLDALGG